jgi:hypothetical protein
MPRHRHYGRRTGRAVRRAGCCGLEALSCCLLPAVLLAVAATIAFLNLI